MDTRNINKNFAYIGLVNQSGVGSLAPKNKNIINPLATQDRTLNIQNNPEYRAKFIDKIREELSPDSIKKLGNMESLTYRLRPDYKNNNQNLKKDNNIKKSFSNSALGNIGGVTGAVGGLALGVGLAANPLIGIPLALVLGSEGENVGDLTGKLLEDKIRNIFINIKNRKINRQKGTDEKSLEIIKKILEKEKDL